MDSSTALAIGLLGVSLLTILGIAIVIWVLYIVAFWKLFSKTGQPGWKSIIPIYNEYIFYKVTWKSSMFWVFLILSFATSLFMSLSGGDTSSAASMGAGQIVMLLIALACSIATLVIYIMQCSKTAKAFGHGTGYCLGLIFLNWIFVLMLGFGSSEYKGPQA